MCGQFGVRPSRSKDAIVGGVALPGVRIVSVPAHAGGWHAMAMTSERMRMTSKRHSGSITPSSLTISNIIVVAAGEFVLEGGDL